MDPFTMIPQIAAAIGIAPSTLVFWVFVINVGSRAVTRRIPDDAVGFWGFVRQLTAILGAEVASRVTSGVTVKDVAKQALGTQPITDRVAEATGEDPATLVRSSTTDPR
jgi:hypothetical protein